MPETVPFVIEKDPAPRLVLAKRWTRVLSAVGDAAVMTIGGMVLCSTVFLSAFGYYGDSGKLQSDSDSLNDISLSSHLLASGVDDDGYVFFYAPLGMRDLYIDCLANGQAISATGAYNDCLAYYYVTYRGDSVASFNVGVLGLPAAIDGTNDSPLWQYDASSSDPLNSLAVLQPSVKAGALAYLGGDTSVYGNVHSYDLIADFFYDESTSKGAYQNAIDDLHGRSEWSLLYEQIDDLSSSLSLRSGLASICAYLAAAAIFFVGLPLIGKSGLTLGKRIMKEAVASSNGKKIAVSQIVGRGIIESVEYMGVIPLLGFFNFAYSGFSMTFLSIGGFQPTLTVFFVASAVILLFSLLMMLFTKRRTSIHDLAVRTIVVSTDYELINGNDAKNAKKGEPDDGNSDPGK